MDGEDDLDDHLSIGGSLTDPSDNDDDEFSKLRKKRSEERLNRYVSA